MEITERIDKRLISRTTYQPDDDVVNLVVAQSEDAESEWIAKEILNLTGHREESVTENAQKFNEKGQSSFVELRPDRGYRFLI